MYEVIIDRHSLKNKQIINPNLGNHITIIKMAKRLRLNLTEFGFVNNSDHAWWHGPFPSFVLSLYEKRFCRK